MSVHFQYGPASSVMAYLNEIEYEQSFNKKAIPSYSEDSADKHIVIPLGHEGATLIGKFNVRGDAEGAKVQEIKAGMIILVTYTPEDVYHYVELPENSLWYVDKINVKRMAGYVDRWSVTLHLLESGQEMI